MSGLDTREDSNARTAAGDSEGVSRGKSATMADLVRSPPPEQRAGSPKREGANPLGSAILSFA